MNNGDELKIMKQLEKEFPLIKHPAEDNSSVDTDTEPPPFSKEGAGGGSWEHHGEIHPEGFAIVYSGTIAENDIKLVYKIWIPVTSAEIGLTVTKRMRIARRITEFENHFT